MSSTSHLSSTTATTAEVLRSVADALDQGRSVVVATVLRRTGSTPATPGQKLALLGGTELVGTVGGGALEHDVIAQLQQSASREAPEATVRAVDLRAAYGMACGGSVELLIEPLCAARSVMVVGAGHVGLALAPLLCQLGFRVVVCDRRSDRVEAARHHESPQLVVVNGSHDDAGVLAALGEAAGGAALLAMTHDHELDERVVTWALRRGFAFVGGVGSRSKAARLRRHLAADGLPEEEVARLRMPLGTPIGARSPAEIAVSIAGELVAWRAGLADRSEPTRGECADDTSDPEKGG